MTLEEINDKKYVICCPLCDHVKCVSGTDKCEAEIWAKQKIAESRGEEMSRHEEFKEREKTINNIFKTLQDIDDPEIMERAVEGRKLEMLTDIADSLATIADSLKEINVRQEIERQLGR